MRPELIDGVLYAPKRWESPGVVGDGMLEVEQSDPEYDDLLAEVVPESEHELAASAWLESEHPRDEDGRFTLKELLSDPTRTEDRPKVKLPANPKVEGLNTAINQWLKGRGGNSMNWVNEIRYEMADMLDAPYYGEEPYDHGMYTQPPPSTTEAKIAAATLLEGLRQAEPVMPELWRGMGANTVGEEADQAIQQLLNAKPGDTFRTLPVSMSTDPGIATKYSSALRYKGNMDRPGIVLRVVPGSRAIKPPRDYFADREVLTAGEYEVLGTERVQWSNRYPGLDEEFKQDALVLTVKQTRGIEAFDG